MDSTNMGLVRIYEVKDPSEKTLTLRGAGVPYFEESMLEVMAEEQSAPAVTGELYPNLDFCIIYTPNYGWEFFSEDNEVVYISFNGLVNKLEPAQLEPVWDEEQVEVEPSSYERLISLDEDVEKSVLIEYSEASIESERLFAPWKFDFNDGNPINRTVTLYGQTSRGQILESVSYGFENFNFYITIDGQFVEEDFPIQINYIAKLNNLRYETSEITILDENYQEIYEGSLSAQYALDGAEFWGSFGKFIEGGTVVSNSDYLYSAYSNTDYPFATTQVSNLQFDNDYSISHRRITYNYQIGINEESYIKSTNRTIVDFVTLEETQQGQETIWSSTVTPTIIVYLGNLALFDDGLTNTGENFLLFQKHRINNNEEIVDGPVVLITREEGWYTLSVTALPPSANLIELEGAALISFGNESGTDNYGIGINSSDDYVNLPPRAISLFESEIKPNDTIKVEYNFRGILGTLPLMNTGAVGGIYNSYMAGTQGIFTDNMYIGDESQYVAFYTDHNGNKQLRIKANQVMYEVTDSETGEVNYHDVASIESEGVPGPPGPAGQDGEDAISVVIDSSAGDIFVNNVISTILRCHVYKGGEEITYDANYSKIYTWKKINIIDGSEDQSWSPTAVPLESNAIYITSSDVDSKAVFQCAVEIEEV